MIVVSRVNHERAARAVPFALSFLSENRGGDRLMDQHWDPIDVEELYPGGGGVGSSSFLADSFHEAFDVRYLSECYANGSGRGSVEFIFWVPRPSVSIVSIAPIHMDTYGKRP